MVVSSIKKLFFLSRSQSFIILIIVFIFELYHHETIAQGFQPLGYGFNNFVYGLTYDSSTNYLYASGNFTKSGSDGGNTTLNHIAKWDGVNWSTVGTGANNAVYKTILFDGDLIAAGYFDTIGGIASQGLARWDGSSWFDLANTSSNNTPYYLGLFVDGNDLYVGGNFDTIAGIPADCIARYDGVNWHNYPSLNSTFNIISAITVFNNELYIGGNFNAGPGKSDIVKWDGSNWVSVGGGFSGGNTHVNYFVQHQNKLYVMGYFYTSFGDPGNCIAIWDGINWSQPSNGVSSSNIFDGHVFNNKIYFGGIIYFADTIPVSNLAVWDGATWGNIANANFSNGIATITSIGNELYFGGGFITVNSDSMYCVTKYFDNTSLADDLFAPEILIYPNPITFPLKITFKNELKEKAEIKIFTIDGKSIYKKSIESFTKNFEINDYFLTRGVYLLQIETTDFIYTKKMVLIE